MTPQSGIRNDHWRQGAPSGMYATDLSWKYLWTYLIQKIKVFRFRNSGREDASQRRYYLSISALTPRCRSTDRFRRRYHYEIRESTGRKYNYDSFHRPDQHSTGRCNGFAGSGTLITFHHDITPLPNGHVLVHGQHTEECGANRVTHACADQ